VKISSGRGSQKCYKLVLDSNIIYSAFYYRGIEAIILEYCSKGLLKAYISEYILEELSRILSLDEQKLNEFLRINRVELVPDKSYTSDLQYNEYVKESKSLSDVGDRPIFIFAKIFLKKNPDAFFITGDKGFFKAKNRLFDRVKLTRDFLDEIWK
jgi:predicted nucleic acid-binding protein